MKEHANAASPEGNLKAGKEYEVKAEFGNSLVAGGYAELISGYAIEVNSVEYDVTQLDKNTLEVEVTSIDIDIKDAEPQEVKPVESKEEKIERAVDSKEVEIAGKGKKK